MSGVRVSDDVRRVESRPTREVEPWWARHVGFAAVALVCVVALVVTRSPFALAGVVAAYTALLRATR